jgi:hypothetical protein
MAKREADSDSEPLAHLALAKREALLAMLQENQLAEAMRLPWEVRLVPENRYLLREDFAFQETRQRRTQERLSVAQASWQELRFRRAAHFALLPARVRRCSQDPGPYAFFRETLVARKCNRAVRCDGPPISARCRPRRNRRGPAGCDSKCSRSQRKRAGLAQPYPIAAEDKRRCHPLPFADQDVRFANSGSLSIPPRRRRTCRKFREKAGRVLS